MERTKNHDNYIFRCVTNRTAPDSCNGNRVREDVLKHALSEQLVLFKDEITRRLSKPSQETEILPELRFIMIELAVMGNITRSLYEDLVTGILGRSEYMELKIGYQIKTDKLKQRAAALQKLLDDEKKETKRGQESLRILNAFSGTLIMTSEHIDRFVDKIIVYSDSRIHAELRI